MNAGDCGSWVVDSHTHEVYGHVVASDAFGEAYVIPMKNTFRCIEKQLSAQRVCLSRQYEEQECIGQKVDEPASEAKVESSMHLRGSIIEGEQSGETCSDQNLFLMRSYAGFPWTEHMVEASPTSQEAGGAGGLEQEISFPMAEEQGRIDTRPDERVSDAQVESSIHLPGSTTEGKQSGETCSGPDINTFTEASLGFPRRPDAGFIWFEQPVEGTSPPWRIAPQENLSPTSSSAVPDHFWNPPFVDSGYSSVTTCTSPHALVNNCDDGAIKLTNFPFSTFGPDGLPSTEQSERKLDEGDSDELWNFLCGYLLRMRLRPRLRTRLRMRRRMRRRMWR